MNYLSTILFVLLAIYIPTIHGFFSERYGDIIINDRQLPQAQFSYAVDVTKVTDTQLYDILARLFGAPRVPSQSELKLNVDLFDRPQGHILFSVEGLSSNRLINPNYHVFGSSPIVDLVPSVEPHNAFSILGTVLTGAEPNVHGIVNDNWPSKDDSKTYAIGNFFDAVAQVRGGRIVSASSSKNAALCLAPSGRQTLFNGLYWDKQAGEYVSSEKSPFVISKSDYPSLFKKLSTLLQRRVVYSPQDGVVSIFEQDGNNAVVFDLADEGDESFVAEVLFVLNAAFNNKVQFFSFHFQSLKGLYYKYGNSEEYETAVFVIDSVISHLLQNYGEEYATTILYFPDTYAIESVETAFEAIVKDHIIVPIGTTPFTAFHKFYPHVYLSAAGKTNERKLCQQVQKALAEFDVEVVCETSNVGFKRGVQQVPQPGAAPSSPTTPPPPSPALPADANTVTLVHVVLWTVVFFILALLVSCLHLSAIDGSGEAEFKARSFEMVGGRTQTQKVQ